MPATAADVPQELFPYILVHLIADIRKNEYTADGGRDSLRCLKACSLVCVDWANRCRRFIFGGRNVTLKSLDDLRTFEKFYKHGCPRLAPIRPFICVDIQQSFDRPSWCHRYRSSPLNIDKEASLILSGPTRAQAAHLPSSPHWSIPRSLPTSSLPFRRLILCDVHLPSFADFFRVVANFPHIRAFSFERVTWTAADADDDAPAVRHPPFHTASSERALEVSVERCTDNALVCVQYLQARRMPSWLPLRDEDRKILLSLFRGIATTERVEHVHENIRHNYNWINTSGSWANQVHYKDPFVLDSVTIKTGVKVTHAVTGLQYFPKFVFFLSLGLLTSHITVLRIIIPADPPDETVNALNAYLVELLHATVPSLPDLTHAEVVAEDVRLLTALLDFKPALRVRPEGMPERIIYRWGCYRSEDQPMTDVPVRDAEFGDVVDIDYATSKPTGQCWK